LRRRIRDTGLQQLLRAYVLTIVVSVTHEHVAAAIVV